MGIFNLWSKRNASDQRPTAEMAVNQQQVISKTNLSYSEEAYSRALQFFSTVPDPDLLLQKIGIRRHQLRLLELDDEIYQCMETRTDAVIGTPWRIEPNQTRSSKWTTAQLMPHMETCIRAVMSAVYYGYSVIEITWKMDNNRITIGRVDERPIEWFKIHPKLGWRYYPDDGSGGVDGVECDPRKFFFTIRNSSTRNPYGESLLSRLWFPVTWRREGWVLWLNFLQTFGQPIIVGRVADHQSFVAAMTLQGVRSTVAWQGRPDDSVTTIQASQSGEFERLEAALTKRIQKLILGQTLTSEVGKVGSYAAATVHNEVRHGKSFTDCNLTVSTVQQIVDVIAGLNNFQPMEFTFSNDTGLEVERSNRDAVLLPVLIASGFKLSSRYFEDRYDYRIEDLEPVAPPPAVTVAPASAIDETSDGTGQAIASVANLLQLAAKPKFTATQQEIEELGDAALKESPANPLDPELLRDAIMSASDEHDLQQRLLVIWEGGPNKEFIDVLEKAQFMASVIGYVSAAKGKS